MCSQRGRHIREETEEDKGFGRLPRRLSNLGASHRRQLANLLLATFLFRLFRLKSIPESINEHSVPTHPALTLNAAATDD